ncbi:hypothetical protein [Shouchella clausii]|uniref:hypothetical protein n=1 Tax=Shouchella clausii TaxID=79880 RepID=UPI001C73C22F|nr:hypothetical protein [Shouchella clausii]MBX0320206.1 hypothetical protein [Shouchella clausii]MEB5480780.1 hypothetical protein [Shouchella clausii]
MAKFYGTITTYVTLTTNNPAKAANYEDAYEQLSENHEIEKVILIDRQGKQKTFEIEDLEIEWELDEGR